MAKQVGNYFAEVVASAQLSDSRPERRQTPRTPVPVITYIEFESDNGGLLWNISEGGLCFQTVNPVEQVMLRIGFSVGDHRIETGGELAWTDETKRKGGLRFSSLSPEMRKQILDWIRTPSASSTPLSEPMPLWETQASRALYESEFPRSSAPDNLASGQEFRHERKAALLGFLPGLFTGLLIAALLAAAFLLGERFGSKQPAQVLSSPPSPPLVPSSHPEHPSVAITPGDKSQQAKAEHAAAATPTSPAPTAPSPTTTIALNSLPISDEVGTVPQLERANLPASDAQTPQLESAKSNPSLGLPEPIGLTRPENANYDARRTRDLAPPYMNSSAGEYFDVGKFKDGPHANELTDQLERLGFHTTIVRSHFLWISSYHVLVGPYMNRREMEVGRKSLESRSFDPRVLPNKSTHLSLPPITLYDTDVTINDCFITWELNSPDATVEFVQGKKVVATSTGRWVKRDFEFKSDAIVTRKNERGPDTLEEIQRAGTDQGLVLNGSVLRVYVGKQ